MHFSFQFDDMYSCSQIFIIVTLAIVKDFFQYNKKVFCIDVSNNHVCIIYGHDLPVIFITTTSIYIMQYLSVEKNYIALKQVGINTHTICEGFRHDAGKALKGKFLIQKCFYIKNILLFYHIANHFIASAENNYLVFCCCENCSVGLTSMSIFVMK